MEERNVSVDRENGGSLATFSLVAVIVVVALIGLFVWQPWNTTPSPSATAPITQPGGPGTSGTNASGNGSSTTTTTSTSTSGGTH